MPIPVSILLVDDQPRNLDALQAILDMPEYRLVRADSAESALLLLLKEEFAAIVLDVKMPGMTGPELAHLIKQRERTRHIPILFLTAHAQDEREVLLAYGAGGVDYLQKPFNPQVLRSKIAVFAELFRKTQQLAAVNLALEAEIAKRERAQEHLRLANEDLEKRVAERTAELLEINQALTAAKADAEMANEAKDRFLAVLSHELRTPLTPVVVSLQLLEADGSLGDDTREALMTIRRNVELEARLIDDLLDLTRVARGKLQLQLQAVDVNTLVRQATQICSPEAAEKGVRLILDAQAGTSRAAGDPARLQQVFWNLIQNAVKFTPVDGEVRVCCRNETRDGEERIVVSVSDTGIGIEPAVMQRVFDAFEQGDRRAGRHGGGLGLGLAISKALVDMHLGTISASSPGPGGGATFVVDLPSAARLDVPSPGVEPPVGADAKAEPCEHGEAARVLLVEDHPDSARVLVQLLRRLGYSVTHTTNVESAVSQAQQQSFDLLISDISLPDGSGHDLLRRLSLHGPVRAIAISGYGMESDVARSQEAGFADHLIKPMTVGQLKSAVERLLPPKRRADKLASAAH
jgi:signal transduction histidine kinase